jgi:hypothetical protein
MYIVKEMPNAKLNSYKHLKDNKEVRNVEKLQIIPGCIVGMYSYLIYKNNLSYVNINLSL